MVTPQKKNRLSAKNQVIVTILVRTCLCDTRACPGSKSCWNSWDKICSFRYKRLGTVFPSRSASRGQASTKAPISQKTRLKHTQVKDLPAEVQQGGHEGWLLRQVCWAPAAVTCTGRLWCFLCQKGGWRDNDRKHLQNTYPANTSPALRTESTSVYNPHWNPRNEWCRELDLPPQHQCQAETTQCVTSGYGTRPANMPHTYAGAME